MYILNWVRGGVGIKVKCQFSANWNCQEKDKFQSDALSKIRKMVALDNDR